MYRCTQCSTIGNKNQIAWHVAKRHAPTEDVPYLCKQCGSRFKLQFLALRHMKSCHPNKDTLKILGGTKRAYQLKPNDAILLTEAEAAEVKERAARQKNPKKKLVTVEQAATKPTEQQQAVSLHPSIEDRRVVEAEQASAEDEQPHKRQRLNTDISTEDNLDHSAENVSTDNKVADSSADNIDNHTEDNWVGNATRRDENQNEVADQSFSCCSSCCSCSDGPSDAEDFEIPPTPGNSRASSPIPSTSKPAVPQIQVTEVEKPTSSTGRPAAQPTPGTSSQTDPKAQTPIAAERPRVSPPEKPQKRQITTTATQTTLTHEDVTTIKMAIHHLCGEIKYLHKATSRLNTGTAGIIATLQAVHETQRDSLQAKDSLNQGFTRLTAAINQLTERMDRQEERTANVRAPRGPTITPLMAAPQRNGPYHQQQHRPIHRRNGPSIGRRAST